MEMIWTSCVYKLILNLWFRIVQIIFFHSLVFQNIHITKEGYSLLYFFLKFNLMSEIQGKGHFYLSVSQGGIMECVCRVGGGGGVEEFVTAFLEMRQIALAVRGNVTSQ